MLKPWREVAVPHRDVLEGTFQQSEFAADITAVRTGKATREYQEAIPFYERTFITEGMRRLLIQVAQRLRGQGGEPVIQLQTAFGGGKTHTMLAVYHLATRTCPLSDLSGIPSLMDEAGLIDVPHARVAVIDGTAQSPGQSWKRGRHEVRTLWGELAWQLGGSDAYALLEASDAHGTSPGKDILRELLAAHAPCVILIDELVAYIRQFEHGRSLSGGSYDSNLSFVQALTEAAKLVPNAMVLASLPESEVEAGSERGVAALRALEKTFARIQALWKPVATEEAFEIVRRRLFESLRDPASRDATCRAFADAYIAEGVRLPAITQERRYHERLVKAYPIHPEVFDRLYEDWTTIDGFQRTRGVLKLMAKVLYRLWKDDNKDPMILPSSLPLYDGNTRNELTYYLGQGWDAVIDRDMDGDRSETADLENKEPRFGQVQAARRVARTLFLGSAPSSVATKPGIRGLDRARMLLGCMQPGQASAVYGDALNRLVDRLHYLNTSGDKTLDTTRFWFDTRANLRREMEDRKRRFDDKAEVRTKLAETLKKVMAGATLFDGVHVFAPHGDVPDDSALRLVVMPPDSWYSRQEARIANEAVGDYLRNNGGKPRYRGNRLLFLAPDHGTLARLIDAARTALAWRSIVDDVEEGKLNVDQLMKKQALKESSTAEEVLPRTARECYRWLLCPVQELPTDPRPTIEAFPLNTTGKSTREELEHVCHDNELVISTWAPIHLRSRLKDIYWKGDHVAQPALAFWEDTLRYLYLPRLKDREVLAQAIRKGTESRDFFGVAQGQEGDRYLGFSFGRAGSPLLDASLLLIEPAAAVAYEAARPPAAPDPSPVPPPMAGQAPSGSLPVAGPAATPSVGRPPAVHHAPPKHRFYGQVDVDAIQAKKKMVDIVDDVILNFSARPGMNIRVTIDLEVSCGSGFDESLQRTVRENCRVLGFRTAEFED